MVSLLKLYQGKQQCIYATSTVPTEKRLSRWDFTDVFGNIISANNNVNFLKSNKKQDRELA